MDNSDSSYSQKHLANQRTFLAWLRTCVAVIGLGFVVARFEIFLFLFLTGRGDLFTYTTNPDTSFQTSTITHYSSIMGTSMVILGIVFAIRSLRNYIFTYKSINRGIYTLKHLEIYLLAIANRIVMIIIIMVVTIIPHYHIIKIV